jgi:hypothetical protein
MDNKEINVYILINVIKKKEDNIANALAVKCKSPLILLRSEKEFRSFLAEKLSYLKRL